MFGECFLPLCLIGQIATSFEEKKQKQMQTNILHNFYQYFQKQTFKNNSVITSLFECR